MEATMFQSLVRGALVALAVGSAGFGAVPASAQGAGVLIDEVMRPELVQYRDYDDRRGDFRRGDDFDRRDDFRGRGGIGRPDFCSPRLALRKAYDIGLNRPRIVREGRRFVIVDGFRRGRVATVRFANDRGCPVLDVRR
jgi:hypothetical protein